MKSTDTVPSSTQQTFPLVSVVALSISAFCGIVLLVFFRSDYALLVGFFSAVLAAASIILSVIGFAFRERPRWLALSAISTSILVIYVVTRIDIH